MALAYFMINNAINGASAISLYTESAPVGNPGLGIYPDIKFAFNSPGAAEPPVSFSNLIYIYQDLASILGPLSSINTPVCPMIWDSTLPSVQVDFNGDLLENPTNPGAIRVMTPTEISLLESILSIQGPSLNPVTVTGNTYLYTGAGLAAALQTARPWRLFLEAGNTPTQEQQDAMSLAILNAILVQGDVLDYLLTLSEPSLTIAPGASDSSNVVNFSPIAGFPDTCILSTDNTLPTGVTISFATNPIGPSSTSSAMTVSVAADAVAGTYSVNIVGTSNPISDTTVETAVLSLTIS